MVAPFFCQYPQADDLIWSINGIGLNQLHKLKLGEINHGFIQLSDGMDGSINTAVLNITALPSYNGSNVTCLALLQNGTTELSSPANLTVQGNVLLSYLL